MRDLCVVGYAEAQTGLWISSTLRVGHRTWTRHRRWHSDNYVRNRAIQRKLSRGICLADSIDVAGRDRRQGFIEVQTRNGVFSHGPKEAIAERVKMSEQDHETIVQGFKIAGSNCGSDAAAIGRIADRHRLAGFAWTCVHRRRD